MTKVGVIMAGLALIFGAMAVRDVRTGNAGFVVAMLRRSANPALFWGLVAAETLAAFICVAVALAAFTMPATCDDVGVCTVVIETTEPTQ